MVAQTFRFPFFLLPLLALPLFAQEAPLPIAKPGAAGFDAGKLSGIGNRVEGWIGEDKLVGAVTLVAREGKIAHLQAHGHADRESGTGMRTDSLFRIHSMTKALTSAAAIICHDRGHWNPDDPISKWIPGFAEMEVRAGGGKPVPAENPVTVAHLLTHSAGLVYGWGGGPVGEEFERLGVLSREHDLAHTADALAQIPLAYEPGTGWSYGTSIDVLGRLVEIWGEMPYEEFLRKELIAPLGMVDTAFHVPEARRGRLATLYEHEGGKLEPQSGTGLGGPEIPSQSPKFCMPGGGLYSTATDYWRFLQMIADGGQSGGRRYLREESVKLMTTSQLSDEVGWIRFGDEVRHGIGYGFGFSVCVEENKRWDPAAVTGEFGWGGAASCHYWVRPEDRLIVITLEQTKPYGWVLEHGLKGLIYEAARE